MRGRSSFSLTIFSITTACCIVGGLRAEEIRHRFVCVDNGADKLTGKIIGSYSLAGVGYSAYRVKNGHTVATAGGAALVQEFDAQGNVVHIWGRQDKHPDVGLT